MRNAVVEAHRLPDIPPLAWLLDLSAMDGPPVLYHGRHVDLFETGFVEGAWDGAFPDQAFDRSANVFGSGAKIGPDSVTFVTPSHTLEPLVAFGGVVSNSLAFLCAYRDLDLSGMDWRSGERFASILLGLGDGPQTIRTRHGPLSVIYHHNFSMTPGGRLEVLPKPLPPAFPDFAAYRDHLLATARQVCANAADPARARRYRPLTTLSSGYDSAAAAVLAKAAGCRSGISLRRSQRGESDSGMEVAAALGLELREYERAARGARGDFSEAQFLSAGMQGEDYVFTAFAETLEGSVLFTGFHGDKIWDRHQPPSDRIKRGDISGCSLGEFRLARDFLHLPVPFIGCRRHADIHRVANSAEMAPYSVGGSYDRPIPRRIAEDAGVPRDAFGQRKRATSLLIHRHPALLSEATSADVASFRRTLSIGLPDRVLIGLLSLRWHAGMALFRWFGRLQRLRGSRYKAVKYPRAVGRTCYAALSRMLGSAEVFEHGHPRNVVWQRWAVARMKERYAVLGRRTVAAAGSPGTPGLGEARASPLGQ